LTMKHDNDIVALPGVGDRLVNSDGVWVAIVTEVLRDDIVITNRPNNRVAEQSPTGKWFLAGSERSFDLVPEETWTDLVERATDES